MSSRVPVPGGRRCRVAEAAAADAARRRALRGLALVELLAAIGIVALLLALALPAVARARASARAAICLSNLRQLGAAWTTYAGDYRVFPVADSPIYWGTISYGWGGVNWFGDGPYPAGFRREPSARPLNPYIGPDAEIESRHLLFRCPMDRGCSNASDGTRPWDQAATHGSAPPDDQRTCFGFVGTSYRANDWMYCETQATYGWGFSPSGTPPLRFQCLAPHSIVIAPSRFIVLGDAGAITAGRMPAPERLVRNLWGSFWHGEESGQAVFLDGSARLLRPMRSMTSAFWSLYPDPARHPGPILRYFVNTW